jgi:phosphoglycerate kinase
MGVLLPDAGYGGRDRQAGLAGLARDSATLDGLEVAGRRVVVRADLNVPMRDGRVTDATRIERNAETIGELAEKGARVIVLSHMGRPKGRRVPELSLASVAAALEETLGLPVAFASDCVGEPAEAAGAALKDGDIVLLENVRYHEQEEANDQTFAKRLADLGDVFVNDAFSTAHRAHASTVGIANFLPALAGRSMEAELDALSRALSSPTHPLGAVVGGAKVSSKLGLLTSLVARTDVLVIGGGMANTFLLAQGMEVGKSLAEPDLLDTARAIVGKAESAGCEIVLPEDVVVAKELRNGVPSKTVDVNSVPADSMILDLGPRAAADISARLCACKTIVWNGPLGAFETSPFDAATNQVAQAVAAACLNGKVLAVAGGGDTVAALTHAGVAEQFSYLSTAGGAFLEWLEGKILPGVAALTR